MSVFFCLTWIAPLLSFAALALAAFVLSPPNLTPSQSSDTISSRVHSVNSGDRIVPSVLKRPLFNQRPPKPQVTDQTAYAGVRFKYQVPEAIDPDGDALTYEVFQGGGSFNPLPDWLAFDTSTRTFTGRQRGIHIDTYTIRVYVSDGQLTSWAEFTLSVVARPENLPPTAASLADQIAAEDQAFSYVVPEFSDPDNNPLTYAAALDDGGTLPGWLSFSETNRTFSGTPLESDTPATHLIRVTATDNATPPLSSSATFTLTVAEVNDAPLPANDSASVTKGGSVEVDVTTLLANDADPEGGALSITAVGGAVNGSVALSEDQSQVTYTHDGSETTSGSFTYTVSDGAATATGTVTVTVTHPNNAPVAVADEVTVAEGGEVEIEVATLLANDTDSDDDSLSLTEVGNAVNGSVVLSEDRSKVTYAHDGSETTTGSFSYNVGDGTDTATGTVSVTVTPVNDAPEAVADTATVAEGRSRDRSSNTSRQRYRPGGGQPQLHVGNAVNGTVAVSKDESKVHDGSDNVWQLHVHRDGTVTSTGTVTVNVTAVNDAPLAGNDSERREEAWRLRLKLCSPMTPDSDTLTVTAVGGAVNGSVAMAEDNSEVTYTHDGSETTTGSFTYTLSDGTAMATGTVSVSDAGQRRSGGSR